MAEMGAPAPVIDATVDADERIATGDAKARTAADATNEATVTANVRELVSEARAGRVDSRFVSRPDGAVRVSVRVEAAPGHEGHVTDVVERYGSATSRFDGSITAVLPPDAVETVADEPGVAAITRPAPAVSAHQGSVVSEGLPNVNVSGELHGSGIDGSNVTVAVVDTGFNVGNDEIDHHVAGSRDFEGDGMDNESGLHGTAVAELVVDTAPNVSLCLYEVETSTQMGAAIEHITRNTSTDVASMSLGLLTGPFDGTSAIDGAINDSVANGTTWVVSAGNYGDGEHYNQTWQDADGDDWLDVEGSEEPISVDADGGFETYVSWAGPDADAQNYDVYLNDSETGEVVDVSNTTQDGSTRAVEIVSAPTGGSYTVAIRRVDADGVADFDLFASGASLQPSTSARSVARPATGPSAIAVGAVYYDDNSLEGFSSRGPTVDGRTKPELVAPDGVSTGQPGSSGLNPFYGTSAATPHAAGVAALVLGSVDDPIGPAELRTSLTDGATRPEAPVPNDRTGYGLVNATGAIAAAGGGTGDDGPGPASLALVGGSVTSDSADASTTVTHEVGVTYANVSADGETDAFDVAFPDAVGGTVLSIGDVTATNRDDGTRVAVESATKVDGPAGDGTPETVRVAVSPTGGGIINVSVNVSVEVAWPDLDSDTQYPIATAGGDSTTGNVSLTDFASVTVNEANEPPTANVSIVPTHPTAGETVALDAAKSTDPDGAIETYEWTVDGEIVGEGESLSYAFEAAGAHAIGLTVTDDRGATNATSTTVSVNAPPTAAVSVTPAEPTVGETVMLDAGESADGDGTITAFEWRVDGEIVGTTERLSYTFEAAGEHTVALTVTDGDGATATASETVPVNAMPTASVSVTPTEPTVGESVTFDGAGSTDGDGMISAYEWTVDGETVGEGASLSYAFEAAGEHAVGLTVTDDDDATDSASVTVSVNAPPTAAFAVAPVRPTIGETVALDGSDSIDGDGTIGAYAWTIDGEVIGEGQSLSYAFETPGEHTIGLTVTDDQGVTNVTSTTVSVNAPPTAAFAVSTTEPTVGESVAFDASGSTDADGDVATYEWDLDGDGQYDDATGVETEFAFSSPGEVIVGLRVADDAGATNATATTLTVATEPTPTPTETADPITGTTDPTATSGTTAGTADPPGEVTTGEIQTDAPGLPGFGVGVAVAALIAVVVLARRRG
jgi:PGF-CTERM protein